MTSAMSRAVDVARRIREDPPGLTAQRVLQRVHDRFVTADLDFPLRPTDVADSTVRMRPTAPPVRADRPLRIGWLTTPPGPGSGGHTTMFRMVEALEQAGHQCEMVLYHRNGGPVDRHLSTIRSGWPGVQAGVRSVDDGFAGLDACIATNWPSAHVLAARGTPGLHELYFVQDYEPFFYPHGSEHELAADSYRFGFHVIALGDMVRNRLRDEVGVSSRTVPFSCDTSVYHLDNDGHRSGVVFYAKPDVPRRGYRLAVLALEEFHRRHPEQPIHVYGHDAADIAAPVIQHRRISPRELNDLYNSAVTGLALSFTNITLVAAEMLASGCIPVVNDSADSRADLDNPNVVFVSPTPTSLADGLCRAVERADPRHARAAAASISRDNWAVAGSGVVSIVEEVVRGRATMDAEQTVSAGVGADAE
jgi:glycosyltransferase involved in cell wall biosynthesis